ncbi:MAG: 2-phosphosulfolactate phosphatase, partial [Bacteroidota bacterium]
ERDGVKLDFADYGNSPFFFTENVVKDMTLVYSTTNGTNAISVGSGARAVLIGSYLNFTALAEKITEMNSDVLLLCAGWKDKYCIEDTVCCGALASKLIEQKTHETICDSVHCAIDQWKLAEKNLLLYIEKAAQRHRLSKIGLDDVIPYCHEFDKTGKVPYFSGNRILSY